MTPWTWWSRCVSVNAGILVGQNGVSILSAYCTILRVCAQAIKHEVDNGATEGKRSATYSAAMAACEKAGQWELAVKLFDKVTTLASGSVSTFV